MNKINIKEYNKKYINLLYEDNLAFVRIENGKPHSLDFPAIKWKFDHKEEWWISGIFQRYNKGAFDVEKNR
jgi:hypothetical protein